MSNKNLNNMREMWSNAVLITNDTSESPKRVIQEVMHDPAPKHDFKKQVELHEKIRNDDDYDDWSYGTEPTYGSGW